YGARVVRSLRSALAPGSAAAVLVAAASMPARAESAANVPPAPNDAERRLEPAAPTILYTDPAPERAATVYVGREARLHDGWYFRFAIGWGALRVSRSSEAESDAAASDAVGGDSAARGSGVAVDIALGGTPFRGASLAGWVSVASLSDGATSELVLVGALFDYFPWEIGGLHFGVGAGLAEAGGDNVTSDFESIESIDSAIGVGFGFSPRLGYEFWIGDQWALGGEIRGTFAIVNRDRSFDIGGLEVETNEVDRFAGGALLISLLHH
ncbi:MAG TPA: hypothetical protein VF989_14140, partial [Polyangiaceae bacterium]